MLYILIPYRDRAENLAQFLRESLPLFNQHLDDFKIIVIEQGNTKPFNRGLLLNVGVKHFAKNSDDDIILHDVDIVPKKHVIEKYYSAKVDKNKILGIYGYEFSIGGISKLSRSTFEMINGFPTNYWGWGYEDLILKLRVELTDIAYTVIHNPKTESSEHNYNILSAPAHESLKYQLNPQNPNAIFSEYFRSCNFENKINIIQRSGLSTTHFKILRHLTLDSDPSVELFTVDI